jgi:hypothetical protein
MMKKAQGKDEKRGESGDRVGRRWTNEKDENIPDGYLSDCSRMGFYCLSVASAYLPNEMHLVGVVGYQVEIWGELL